MIKVIHLQVSSELTGRAPLRLHRAFLNAGIESKMISLKLTINDTGKNIQKGKVSQIVARLDNLYQFFSNRKNIREFGLFSYPMFGSDVSKMKEIHDADYIYIHWILGGFLNLRNIKQLARLGKPVIFFMHDMWTITGGCHYSFNCQKYTSTCFNCQIFPKNKNNDLASREFKKKLRLYTNYKNLYFVSPSKWLYNCATNSALTKDQPNFYIPNIIDKSFFKPFAKSKAKEIFNIDYSEMVVSFGAISIDSPYKGWPYLLEALRILFNDEQFKKITILVFGSGYKKEIELEIPYKTKFIGHLSDEYSTMLAYNASDVFVAPSLADNLPTTVLESLSCGTAVVGFNVGGIPDMIRHKENGYLARYRDANDLSQGIKYCLQQNIQGNLSADFDSDNIINKHLRLFEAINQK